MTSVWNQVQNIIRRVELMRLGGFPAARLEDGQTLVEYALILVLIAVVVVVAVGTLGHTVRGIFSNVASSI